MSLTRRDLPVLLVAVAAGVASVAVWAAGQVEIGMTLQAEDGRVYVADVTPDGNAARYGFQPRIGLLDLTTVDGTPVARGAPLVRQVDGVPYGEPPPWWEPFGSGGSGQATLSPPAEAVASDNIATAVAGWVDANTGEGGVFAAIQRAEVEYQLSQSIWLAGLGLLLGIGLWRILAHGLGGSFGREQAIPLASATATPFLVVPMVQAGAPIGIYAGYLLPAASLLLVGLVLVRRHPERTWVQTGTAVAVGTAVLAAALVGRHMSSPFLSPGERGAILLVIMAIGAVPAAIAALGAPPGSERARQLSLSLVPVVAVTANLPTWPDPVLPLVLLVGLLGWQLAPLERAWLAAGRRLDLLRPAGLRGSDADPSVARWRNLLTAGLLLLVAAFGVAGDRSLAAVAGVALAAVVWIALRQGFLGRAWTDAAIPLATAVGMPFMLHAYAAWDYGGAMGWASSATALPALSVAHLLAARHTDERWRARLFLGSVVVAAVAIWLGGLDLPLALVFAGLVPLVPGLPAAFAEEPGEARALTGRLETLAIALTPGVAATALIPGTNAILLGAWLVAIVVWRRFTLAPLLGLAQRTQLQRDLAVAAAETERARLAADLHDDALQQLTMLVRSLDEAGHEKEAGEAREIATKLRSIVGDLRLPILDDLGAGAALEWLVERVEPLAGGPVRLERSDQARPPANVELAVFRVAQEALTNAIKHGRPPIAVHYDVRADGRVTLAIDDAGPGIGPSAAEEAPHQGHFGLANMQQRAEQIGAMLDVRRWPAGGTRVALEWRPG
jgi:signal transduction histidine kinase